MAILDKVETGLFITTKDAKLSGLPTLGLYNKNIAVADKTVIHTSHKTRPPYTLTPSAMESDVVLTFHNSLIGVKPFADTGFISIFHPHQGGVTIYHLNDIYIKYLKPLTIKGVR